MIFIKRIKKFIKYIVLTAVLFSVFAVSVFAYEEGDPVYCILEFMVEGANAGDYDSLLMGITRTLRIDYLNEYNNYVSTTFGNNSTQSNGYQTARITSIFSFDHPEFVIYNTHPYSITLRVGNRTTVVIPAGQPQAPGVLELNFEDLVDSSSATELYLWTSALFSWTLDATVDSYNSGYVNLRAVLPDGSKYHVYEYLYSPPSYVGDYSYTVGELVSLGYLPSVYKGYYLTADYSDVVTIKDNTFSNIDFDYSESLEGDSTPGIMSFYALLPEGNNVYLGDVLAPTADTSYKFQYLAASQAFELQDWQLQALSGYEVNSDLFNVTDMFVIEPNDVSSVFIPYRVTEATSRKIKFVIYDIYGSLLSTVTKTISYTEVTCNSPEFLTYDVYPLSVPVDRYISLDTVQEFSCVAVDSSLMLDNAFTMGYNSGFKEGYSSGYGDGTDDGYTVGYREGYTQGEYYGYGKGYQNGEIIGSQDGYDNGYKKGYEFGKQEGYREGNKDGYLEGHDDGYAEGQEAGAFITGEVKYQEGYDAGYSEGYNSGELVGFDKGYQNGELLGSQNGYDNGYNKGYEFGKQDGYKEGNKDGYLEGHDDGYAEGQEAGAFITGEVKYEEGFEAGYSNGTKDGYYNGYEEGYLYGYDAGLYDADDNDYYQVGYDAGLHDGLSQNQLTAEQVRSYTKNYNAVTGFFDGCFNWMKDMFFTIGEGISFRDITALEIFSSIVIIAVVIWGYKTIF